MRYLLYTAWFLIPAFFFAVALWAKLEKMSGKEKRENPGDFFRQGVFVLICVLIALAIDQYLLVDLVLALSPDWLPLGFYQVMLLPFILLVGAKLVGPSTPIRITKAPRSGAKKR